MATRGATRPAGSSREREPQRRRSSRQLAQARRRLALLIALGVAVAVTVAISAVGGSPTRVGQAGGSAAPDVSREAAAIAGGDAAGGPVAFGIDPRTAAAIPLDLAVRHAGGARREVALTFDDGPGQYTQQVLDVLERYGMHATFFVVGRNVQGYERAVRAVVRAGSVIGDHTWAHTSLVHVKKPARVSELEDAASAIAGAGGQRPAFLRPPYGATDGSVNRLARTLGLVPILWDVDSRDYVPGRTGADIAREVLTAVRPGSIVLLHDGGGDRSATIAALPRILAGLQNRGLAAVTLPRLLDDSPPNVGDPSAFLRDLGGDSATPKGPGAITAGDGGTVPPA